MEHDEPVARLHRITDAGGHLDHDPRNDGSYRVVVGPLLLEMLERRLRLQDGLSSTRPALGGTAFGFTGLKPGGQDCGPPRFEAGLESGDRGAGSEHGLPRHQPLVEQRLLFLEELPAERQ